MSKGLILLACLLSAWASRAQRPVRVGLIADKDLGSFPFAYQDPSAPGSTDLTGYEVALMQFICKHANFTCEPVLLPNLEDRIFALENQTIDFTISQLSFTPARALSIDFVRPFYYSTGVALYAEQPQASGSILAAPSRPNTGISWSSFTGGSLFGSGNRVCFLQGYYALAFLVTEYKVDPVITDSLDSAVAKVKGGDCAAFAYESAVPTGEVDLPPLNIPPAYVSPYGVGIRRGDKELHDAIALALLAAMDKGNTSAILQYEQDYLVKNGVQPNKALTNLVTAISSFDIPTSTAVPSIPSSYTFLGR